MAQAKHLKVTKLRDTKTGRFVTAAFAKRRPKSTQAVTVKIPTRTLFGS